MDRMLENARITLAAACRAQPGESVLIIHSNEGRYPEYAAALERAAWDLKLMPMAINTAPLKSLFKGRKPGELVLPPLKAALEAADITIKITSFPGYNLMYGIPGINDSFLTGRQRRMLLMPGMESWEMTTEAVAGIRIRTEWLDARLRRTGCVRVTSPAGTDFSFALGAKSKWVPILGIVPLFGEIAITPQLGTENGVFVVDGPTASAVRPPAELDRMPLEIVVENGAIKEKRGDPEQLARLERTIANARPPVAVVDEVGLVTTPIAANDACWHDGTHQHDTVHIALGNNLDRDNMVHGSFHVDCEIKQPAVYLDGQLIMEQGAYCVPAVDVLPVS